MEIPRPRDHGGLPTILYNDDHYPSSPRGFSSSHRPAGFSSRFSPTLSGAMSIPNAPSYDEAPPPLPPPRFVPVEGPQPDHSNFLRREEYNDSVYGSLGESLRSSGSMYDDRSGYKSRDHGAPMRGRDEGYASLSSFASSRSRDAPTQFRVHDQYQFRSSADNSYDNQLLKKLDTKRAYSPPRRSGLSSSVQDAVAGRPSDRPYMQLKPLSLPTRIKQQPLLESPGRYSETPATSAISPRSTPFTHGQNHEYRSPIDPPSSMDFERSPIPRSRRTNSGSVGDDLSVSTESYDNETDFPMEETSRLRAIHLDEPHHSRMSSFDYQTIGQKRRASSPPGDEPPLHSMSSQSDLLRRRDGVSRGSPTPRLTVIPQHNSVSSVSSTGRSGSYASQLSLATASSMTSAHSFGRRSPVGLSPSGLSPTDPTASPFMTPNSLTMSPRSTMAQRIGPHQRALSDQKNMVSPRKLTETLRTNGTVGKIQGFFMCDCCPKKPKKFETAEELSAHEAEKQYECSFCGNRFKNKNEAERHQNSLHVRRHSWSCSALSGYDRAFHESTTRPGEADTCGYCGEEFVRSGSGPAGHMRHATDQDWEVRIRHLQDTHKFRECNSSKKFYRADHFRQHLKHSHAGTSGKWTNMLENACMLEEEPPQPAR